MTDSSEDIPPATQNFIIPKKEIHTVPDMGKWKRSQAYADYIGFILTLNEGVKGKKLSFEYRVSEVGKGRSLPGRVFPKIAVRSPQWAQRRN
nr:serine/threonine-protein phosphatase 2A activator isoform X2 [Globicephala melas]